MLGQMLAGGHGRQYLESFAAAKEMNLDSKNLCDESVLLTVVQPVIDSLKE